MSGGEGRDFEEALRYVGDADRLLEGEDPDTLYPEDAAHWESVYRELHTFKEGLVETAQEMSLVIDPDGRVEVENDVTILRAEAGRLRARLDFWRRRRRQLEGGGESAVD